MGLGTRCKDILEWFGDIVGSLVGGSKRFGGSKRRNYQFDAHFGSHFGSILEAFWVAKSAYEASVLGCVGLKASETVLNAKICKKVQKSEKK